MRYLFLFILTSSVAMANAVDQGRPGPSSAPWAFYQVEQPGTPVNTPTPTPTSTFYSTDTPTVTSTFTPTNTLPAGTNTFTPLPTSTFTNTPVNTSTPLPTFTPTSTFTPGPAHAIIDNKVDINSQPCAVVPNAFRTAAAATSGSLIDLGGIYYGYPYVQAYTNSAIPTAMTCTVQTSVDEINWSAALISLTATNVNAGPTISSSNVARFMRLNVSTFTAVGGGAVTFDVGFCSLNLK